MRRRQILFYVANLTGVRGVSGSLESETSFDFVHNQIILRASINGSGPYTLLLDSGTHGSVIDLQLAHRLRLQLQEGLPVGAGAGGGRALGQRTVVAELGIGDLKACGVDVTAIDLRRVSRSLGRPLDGVVGYGFLGSRIVEINYFRRRVRFRAAAPPAEPDSSSRTSFPMQFLAGSVLPVIEDCYVNGSRIPVSLDTGSSLGFILFPATIARLGLKELAREGTPIPATGYLGQARLARGWVRSVKLRSIDLGAIEVAYVEKGYGDGEDPEKRGGSVGNAVLQDFVVTLDYRNHKVILERVNE